MSVTQKPSLALWAPSFPQVHIQGNLSTDLPRKDTPRSCLPRLGPAPSFVGPNFLLITEVV